MSSSFDIEQPVRLAQHQHSLLRSEPKDTYCKNPNDQKEFVATRCTTYEPRAAVFVSEIYNHLLLK